MSSTKICPLVQAQCGNGLVESGEACDDGNVLFADGCDILCQVRFYMELPLIQKVALMKFTAQNDIY